MVCHTYGPVILLMSLPNVFLQSSCWTTIHKLFFIQMLTCVEMAEGAAVRAVYMVESGDVVDHEHTGEERQ